MSSGHPVSVYRKGSGIDGNGEISGPDISGLSIMNRRRVVNVSAGGSEQGKMEDG
jgi:hypothetical protein